MSPRRVAMLSLHTSPLAQPGLGDGGGMNVYVRSLAAALARAGVECDLLTRADRPGVAPVIRLEPGVRVVNLQAGPPRPVAKAELLVHHDELVDAAARWIGGPGAADVLHANYYVSGAVAHTLKHRLGIPMVTTFHTLARAKEGVGIHDDPADRVDIETAIVSCADGLVVSTEEERTLLVDVHDAVAERIEVIPPGVDHAVFTPGRGTRVRRHWKVGDDPVLLVVGRIQPLKGFDLAIRTLAALGHPRAHLVIVGGPSGAEGEAELARLHALVAELGLGDRVRFEPPRAHDALAAYYRAADVVLVPSRTESFGLVALEAAACGVPVVATAVGGLRSVVEHGASGYIVDDRDPIAFAAYVRKVLDDSAHAGSLRAGASVAAQRFTWSIAAARLRRLYADVPARELVRCS
ncbi:MAG: glycosyltransferase family 1 protein [Actinobacteria bacterium]|nr:glycosyltransferase family 1 protein [Actinomycetota bacterium]